jgi:hypothetical protein
MRSPCGRPMDEKREWQVRDGTEQDMEGILSLRRLVFGEVEKDKLHPRFWKWEFIDGPDGRALTYIIEDGGGIVAHFADIPHHFMVNRKLLHGTLSLDLMVHPDYRRRGFFSLMGRYASRRVKSQNWEFMTAFPIREETIQGLLKLGWKKVIELPVLVYPIRFQGILDRYLHFSPAALALGAMARLPYNLIFRGPKLRTGSGELVVEETKQIDPSFDAFWEKTAPSFSILGVRSSSYLRRRYLEHPSWSYTIFRTVQEGETKGYVVLRKIDLLQFKSAIVVDLLAFDQASLEALVAKAVAHSREQGRDLLGFMLPKDHRYYRALRKMGFLPSGKRFFFMVYPHGHEKELLIPRDWYVTWGDTDVM